MDTAQSMSEALELAREAERADEVPVGAVILHEGRVVGRGRNDREESNDPTGHAEIRAIQAAARALGSWRLEKCTLVVTLEPCPMCLAAVQQSRIPLVIYGAQDPKGGALSLGYRLNEDSRTNHRFEVRYEPEPRCSSILTEFFRKKRQGASAKS